MSVTGPASVLAKVPIDHSYPSENHNARIRLIVLHYTTGDWQNSVEVLTKPGPSAVSAHYLIPESGDSSYPKARPLQVYQLVNEQQRAWHAGNSRWQQLQSVNDQSIGIELVNRSRCEQLPAQQTPTVDSMPATVCLERDFDPAQIQLLVGLLQQILSRHPDIEPTAIVAHSDVAPGRKQDPGSRFPWRELARQGIGAWYDDATYLRYLAHFRQHGVPALPAFQQALAIYGYGLANTGLPDRETELVVRAFQRHFVQHRVQGLTDGQPDVETAAALYALLEKYYPRQLAKLPQMPISSSNPTIPPQQ